MQVVFTCCCGLDVHKNSVVACLLKQMPDGSVRREVRTFGTLTAELLRMRDWLTQEGCTHVAIESTGVYWKPVFNVLEDAVEVWLINAQHLKRLPGRKTDVQDSEWLADLLRHGLVKPSFIPPAPTRELRELTRYRIKLIQQRAAEANRIQKVLESANLKLGSVASDVLGVSGRAILEAVVAGQTDPQKLADLGQRLHCSPEELIPALEGYVQPHHRLLLREHLDHVAHLERSIERLSAEIERRLGPFEEEVQAFDQVPGVGRRTAQDVLAEIGTDMSVFPSAAHLASWAGLCPGHNESAGKHRSGKTRKGSPWLRGALVEAAWSAVRKKDSYFRAQYFRLKGRRGPKKAIIAVAHSILEVLYHLLKQRKPYRDLGADHFDRINRQAIRRRLVHRLESLGYVVTLEPKKVAV